MVGEAGKDHLRGGDAADIILGGPGKDQQHGGKGDDLLYGGSAANELDLAALDAALEAWKSGDLSGTLTALGLLTDDLEKDQLHGNQGTDELIPGVGDILHP